MIGRHEILVGCFGGFGRGDCGRDQDAIAERDAGIGGKGEIQLFLAIAENFLAERVGGEEAIAAGMPVGGKAWIARVVENGDGDRLGADETAEIAPPPARAPGGIALFAFTREVGSIDAGVVQLGDGRGATAGIGVNLRFFRGDFESANNTKAQHAVLFIGERNSFVKRAECGDAVDAAKSGAAAEDEVCMFLEQNFFVESDPITFDVEFALIGTAFCGDDRTMENGAHLGGVFRLDGVGIVPEIDAIYIFVVKPKAGVMGMIDAFAGALVEREAASDDGSFGGTERIEDWFLERGGPDVGSERLAVNGNVDPASLLVDGHGNAVGRMRARGGERDEKRRHGYEDEGCTGNENAHG